VAARLASYVLILATAAPAAAQTQPSSTSSHFDRRWQPWLGCWQAESPEAARVCVTPHERGVRMITSVDGQPVFEQVIVADGSAQPFEDRGCRGTQRAEWSQTGARLFGRAELACPGDKPHGVSHLAMLRGDVWLDILGVTGDGREGIRVRRYRRAAGDNRDLNPPAASLTIDDVKEASGKVTPMVLQAALVETDARLPIDGRTLIELDKAGVPDAVTDVMVALSFPGSFKVDRPRPTGGGGPWGHGYEGTDSWWFAPFTYSYWGFANAFDSPEFIVIEAGGSGDGVVPDGNGRAINGRGYTRIQPRDEGRAVDRGSQSSGASASTTSDGSSGGSTGSVSSGGYSSGESSGSSGGGDSGRTAVPR
jgi:uncharacterized membrane protein YgcG